MTEHNPWKNKHNLTCSVLSLYNNISVSLPVQIVPDWNST